MKVNKLTKGQTYFSGILSLEEIDEFDALEQICTNLTDPDGKGPCSLLKFIERKTELLRKANAVFNTRCKPTAAATFPLDYQLK